MSSIPPTADYHDLLGMAEIDAIYISATPETTHYPMARDCLAAGKHVFLEKPIALELAEAALVSRHITRTLGKKISGRIKLSPAAMEATHDLDFVLWCLESAKPARAYSQTNFGAMRDASGTQTPDTQWIMVSEQPVAARIGFVYCERNPAAARPASAHCSSRSDVSPLIPTAPIT